MMKLLKDIPIYNSKRNKDKTAFICDGREYSFKEINEKINKTSNFLLSLNIKKGDRIAYISQNRIDFVIFYFASSKIGTIFIPINYRLTEGEISYILNNSRSKIFIFDNDHIPIIESLSNANKDVEYWINIDDFDPKINYYNEPSIEIKENDPVAILYTSGTTGKPKGVLQSNRNIISGCVNLLLETSIDEEDINLLAAPIYHAAALNCMLIPHFYRGCTQVILPKFDPDIVLKSIEKYKVNNFLGIPTMFNMLCNHPDINKYDVSSLRKCFYGGAIMPVEVLKRSIEIFRCDFYNLFGQTESTISTTTLKPKDQLRKAGSIGKANINAEMRVVDDKGNDIRPGEVGEIILKGENIMIGYFEMPEATKEALKDGWLHTGDLGIMDDEGYVTVVDRKKDMIISGGENIYPREVEEVIFTHPEVLDVAIFGFSDPLWGEKPVAAIVLKKQGKLKPNDIIEYCKGKIANYKIPREIIFLKELPRSTAGKVLKSKLREIYRDVAQ